MTTATTTPAVTLTAIAKQKLQEYLAQEPSETCVRVIVEDDGRFGLSLDTEADGDARFPVEAIPFVVEAGSLPSIEGLRIDYLNQGAQSGFSLTGGKAVRPGRAVIRTETTPNPNAMKFVLAFNAGPTSRTWSKGDPDQPAVVQELFRIDGVESVFEGGPFVTITRRADAAWEPLVAAAKEALAKLEPPAAADAGGPASDAIQDRIGWFIRTEVAPFLQQDGGDIELLGVEGGTVKVRLVGACGTCPSSLATLQFGVERRLKEKFPAEVARIEVVNPAGGHGHHHHGHGH